MLIRGNYVEAKHFLTSGKKVYKFPEQTELRF